MQKTDFKKGETVVCTASRGAEFVLTLNKTYVVVQFFPEVYEPNLGGFVWPAYVKVMDDNGKLSTFHANRFSGEGA